MAQARPIPLVYNPASGGGRGEKGEAPLRREVAASLPSSAATPPTAAGMT